MKRFATPLIVLFIIIFSVDAVLSIGSDFFRGWSSEALESAVLEERCVDVERLLKKGADPNHISSESGMSVVQFAAEHSDICSLKLLLRHGADPDKKDGFGTSARSAAKFRAKKLIEDWDRLLK